MAAPPEPNRRIGSLEEILHTNELTVSNILGRLKEVELLLSQKARGQASIESVNVLGGELLASKQRLEHLERGLNVGIQKLEDEMSRQLHDTGAASQQRSAQAVTELSDMKHHLAEVSRELKKIDTAVNDEQRFAKQVELDSKAALEKVSQQFHTQSEQLRAHQHKIEDALSLVSMEAKERDNLAVSVKHAFESSLTALAEQNNVYIQQEVHKRVQLTHDIVSAFKRLRVEIAAGFKTALDGQQEAERAVKSVEMILRAEIKSRMHSTESQARMLHSLDDRAAGDSAVLADGVKTVDEALAETRAGLASEVYPQLGQLATRVFEVQESLAATNGAVAALQAASHDAADLARRAEGGGAALRTDLRGFVASEVEAVQAKVFACGADVSALRAENGQLRSEVASLRTSVTALQEQAEAAGEGHAREVRELAEAAVRERDGMVTQVQRALDHERTQWEAVAKRLHDDAVQRHRADKEAMRKLRASVREASSGSARVGAAAAAAAPIGDAAREQLVELRADVDELYEFIEHMQGGVGGGGSGGGGGVAHKDGDVRFGAHQGRGNKFVGLLAKESAGELRHLEHQVEEVRKACTERGEALVKSVAAAEDAIVQQAETTEKEGLVRQQETYQLREAVERVAAVVEDRERLRAQQAVDLQAQVDEVRQSLLLNMKKTDASEKRLAEARRLLEDQISGCSRAHAEHQKRGVLQAQSAAALQTQCEQLQEELLSHAAFLDEIRSANA